MTSTRRLNLKNNLGVIIQGKRGSYVNNTGWASVVIKGRVEIYVQ